MILTISEYGRLVTDEIGLHLDIRIQSLTKLTPFLQPHLSYLKKLATIDGKRIRAYLVYLGANMEEDTLPTSTLALSSAIELFHTSILIHDDIMDMSEIRRGIPAFHTHEAKYFNDIKLGENIAIAIADAGFFIAQEIIAKIKTISPAAKIHILQDFSAVAIQLSYGQVYDLTNTITSKDSYTFPELADIYNLKTGLYTFTLPLHMGLYASGNKPTKAIDEFAYNAGIVFQFTDDLLDFFSDTSGKPKFNDLQNGKITSVIRLMLDTFNEKDTAYITAILNHTAPLDSKKINHLLKKYTINEILDTKIAFYTQNALHALTKTSIRKEVADALSDLILSLQTRLK